MKFLTFDPKKRSKVLVGDIVGDTLTKKVNPAKHFMRVVDGYGIQYQAIQELKEMGIKTIVIEESTGKSWKSPLSNWEEHSKTADYGNGKQVFLSLKYMSLK